MTAVVVLVILGVLGTVMWTWASMALLLPCISLLVGPSPSAVVPDGSGWLVNWEAIVPI